MTETHALGLFLHQNKVERLGDFVRKVPTVNGFNNGESATVSFYSLAMTLSRLAHSIMYRLYTVKHCITVIY